MGLGKVIALDDLLDNARRRAIRLEISAMRDESSLSDLANIELLSNQIEAAQRLLREISEPEALASDTQSNFYKFLKTSSDLVK